MAMSTASRLSSMLLDDDDDYMDDVNAGNATNHDIVAARSTSPQDELELGFYRALQEFTEGNVHDITALSDQWQELMGAAVKSPHGGLNAANWNKAVQSCWLHEQDSWALATQLFKFNTHGYQAKTSRHTVRTEDLWENDGLVEELLYSGQGVEDNASLTAALADWGCSYRYLDVVRQWLEAAANRERLLRSVDRDNESGYYARKLYYANSLAAHQHSPGAMLDPDAYSRNNGLDHYDKQNEKKLWRNIYELVRCGQWRSAVEQALASGFGWIAAMLLNNDAYGPTDDRDSAATEHLTMGNRSRAFWKKCCKGLADTESEDVFLKAFVGLYMSGYDSTFDNPAYRPEVCRTFEDHLWVSCMIAKEEILQNAIDAVNDTYGVDEEAKEGEPMRLDTATTRLTSQRTLEVQVESIVKAAVTFAAVNCQSQEMLLKPYHQVQAYLIQYATSPSAAIGQVLSFLVPLAESSTGGQSEQNTGAIMPAVQRNYRRFLAHYSIFLLELFSDLGIAAPHAQRAMLDYIDSVSSLAKQPRLVDCRGWVSLYCSKLQGPERSVRYSQFVYDLLDMAYDEQIPSNRVVNVAAEHAHQLLDGILEIARGVGLDLEASLLLVSQMLLTTLDEMYVQQLSSATNREAQRNLSGQSLDSTSEAMIRRLGLMAVMECCLLGCIDMSTECRLETLTALVRSFLLLGGVEQANQLLEMATTTPGFCLDAFAEHEGNSSTTGCMVELDYYRRYVDVWRRCQGLTFRCFQKPKNQWEGVVRELQQTVAKGMLTPAALTNSTPESQAQWSGLRCAHLYNWTDWLIETSRLLADPGTPLAMVSRCLADVSLGYASQLATEDFRALLAKCVPSIHECLCQNNNTFSLGPLPGPASTTAGMFSNA